MYLFLSLPILIANLFFSSIAFYDICKHYEFSTFKPRLVLVAVIIFSNIPASLAYVFPDMITNGFLMNEMACYFFVLVSHCFMLKYYALIALTVFIGLIIFTKFSVARLNRIGRWLNFAILAMFIFHELVLIFMSGWKQVDFDTNFNDLKHPKRCLVASTLLFGWTGFLSITCTTMSITASVVFLLHNALTEKFKKRTSSYRISICFFFFAIANLTAMAARAIEKIRKEPLSKTAKWVALDLGKIVPALFAIVYLLTEAWGRLSNLNFGIRRILQIKKCRRLFQLYLSDIGAKKAYELIDKWERLNSGKEETMDVLDRQGLNKQEANAYMEKFLELEVCGFLSTEAFNDFNVTYNFGGLIEANLAEEVEIKNDGRNQNTD